MKKASTMKGRQSMKRLTATSAVLDDDETSLASTDSTESGELPVVNNIRDGDGDPSAPAGKMKNSVLEVEGIRFTPAYVTFENLFEGQTYSELLRLQNVSSRVVPVRIAAPRSWAFRVQTLLHEVRLAPGMQLMRRVRYICAKNNINTSSLPVYINDSLHEIPLYACRSNVIVDISPTVLDFGRLDLGSKPVERHIIIRNLSACATQVTIDTARDLSNITVTPVKGRVRPQGTLTITVRLLPDEEGNIDKELWILTHRGRSRVAVTAEVYRHNLLVVHPNTTGEFTLIDFKPTFYGCERNETFIVYNKAAVTSYVVVLAEINNALLMGFEDVHCNRQEFRMFKVEPEEGKLLPFEGRIFTVRFMPVVGPPPEKGWKSKKEAEETTSSFLVMIKVLHIQVQDYEKPIFSGNVDKGDKKSSKKHREKILSLSDFQPDIEEEPKLKAKFSTCKPPDEELSARLCLYGEAEMPRVTVQPDALYFTDMTMDSRETRVLRMTNTSSKLPLAIRFVKTACFEVEPNFQFIKPSLTFDVLVIFRAQKRLGKYSKELKFEVLAYGDMTTNESLRVVNHAMATAHVDVTSAPTAKTRIAPTKSALIKCTMKAMPKAILNSLKQTKDQRRPSYEVEMTYTEEEMKARQLHRDWYLQWMRGTAAQLLAEVAEPSKPLYDISCSRLYLMTGAVGKRDDAAAAPQSRLKDAMPRDVMVPLTMLQLYNIKIDPLCISFGMVTTSKDCTQPLTINNYNQFGIGIRFVTKRNGIKINRTKDIVVKPMSKETVLLTFQAKKLGQHTEKLTVVMNEHHMHELTAIAEVVPKTLTLDPKAVEIKTIEDPFSPDFYSIRVGSSLSTPVNFSWDIPAGSPFKIEPLSGIVPKQGSVFCALYFDPDGPNYKMGPVQLLVDGVKCQSLKTSTLFQRPTVYFTENVLNVGTLPLNTLTLRNAIMFNAGYSDVMFVVLNATPANGVAVEPTNGIVKARSCISLKIYFTVEQVANLDFLVYVTVQTMMTLELKVTGTVVYPAVEIKPNYIRLMHVPCYSASRTSLVAHNHSPAVARVRFNMTDYPQFHVSINRKPHDPWLGLEGITMQPGASQKFYLHFLPQDLASYDFYLPVVVNDIITTDKDAHRGKSVIQLFRKSTHVIIATNKQKSVFQKPPKPNPHAKKSVSLEMTNKHLVFVDCTVSKALVHISDTELHLTEGDEPKCFTLSNETNEPLGLHLHVRELPPCFTVTEVKREYGENASRGEHEHAAGRRSSDGDKNGELRGNDIDVFSSQTDDDFKEERLKLLSRDDDTTLCWQLRAGEKATISALYLPTSTTVCAVDVVDLNLTVDGHATVYNTIRLKGVALPKNRLSISNNEVYLTPVPLCVHVESLLSLKLADDGSNTSTCLQHTIQEPYGYYLDATYMDTNCLMPRQPKGLDVRISFSSKVPVSFKAEVHFFDDTGNSCKLSVYATADNSLLTTHAFLFHEFGSYRTLYVTDKEHANARKASLVASASSEEDDDMDVGSARMSSQLIQYAMSNSTDNVTFHGKAYVVQDSNVVKLRRSMLPKQAIRLHKMGSFVKPGEEEARKTILEAIAEQESVMDASGSALRPKIKVALRTSEDRLPLPDSSALIEYPLFPVTEQMSDDAVHMKRTMVVVERWIYEQGFNCLFNPTLDDQIFTTFADVVKSGQRTKHNRSVMRNVLDLLERLCGREVRRYFTPIERMPAKEPDRVFFIHQTYSRVIEFVQAQGGLICHVEPHLLMYYDDYVRYTDAITARLNQPRALSVPSSSPPPPSDRPVPPPLVDRHEFQSRSKQCWLDLMLQTVKFLMMIPYHRQTIVEHGVAAQRLQKIPKRVSDSESLSRVYSKFESELVCWLSHHYNTQRTRLWGKDTCPPAKNVTNFDQDLEDCLVLTAVTAAYCPYLTPLHFHDMFIDPDTSSQAYHNAVCLTSAWHRIRLGFTVLPKDFTPPNTVQMVLLVAHLYRMLPTYVPETTVSFTSTLNTSEVQNIELDNTSDSTLTYYAHIIGDACSFALDGDDTASPFIVVKHKSNTTVAVKYTARKTTKVTGILLVCGACFPPKFGRNFAFSLEGHPVKLPVSAMFNITSPLNTISRTSVSVTTPHQPEFTTSKETHYEIWYTETEPHPGEVNIRPWQEVCKRKLPRRLYVLTEKLEIPGGERHASGNIALQLTCFSMEQRDYWLVFINRKVGDFIVKIVSKVCDPPPQTADQLIGEAYGRVCYVDVPCRDAEMWSAVRKTFELTLTDAEKNFWTTHLRTNIGLHLLNWLLVNDGEDANYNEIKHLFVKRQTYHVSLAPSDCLTVSPTLTIEDVRLEGTTKLTVHVGEDCSLPVTTTLRMRTAGGSRARCYKLTITRPII